MSDSDCPICHNSRRLKYEGRWIPCLSCWEPIRARVAYSKGVKHESLHRQSRRVSNEPDRLFLQAEKPGKCAVLDALVRDYQLTNAGKDGTDDWHHIAIELTPKKPTE